MTGLLSALDRGKLLENAQAVLDHNGSDDERQAAFPEFSQSNSKLFRMLCSGRCNIDLLQMMMSRIADIESGTMSVEQASANIAHSLNAKYIESVLPPPTPEQMVGPGGQTQFTVSKPGEQRRDDGDVDIEIASKRARNI